MIKLHPENAVLPRACHCSPEGVPLFSRGRAPVLPRALPRPPEDREALSGGLSHVYDFMPGIFCRREFEVLVAEVYALLEVLYADAHPISLVCVQ